MDSASRIFIATILAALSHAASHKSTNGLPLERYNISGSVCRPRGCLLTKARSIAGFYTLAMGEVSFDALPAAVTKSLPKRSLPVAVLAWLGIGKSYQGRGLGKLLCASSLRDCYDAGQTFAFVAVIIDCLNDHARSFYTHWDFEEVPGHPYRLFVSSGQLDAMMRGD